MNFLCLDRLRIFGGWVDLVLNGELGKRKAVRRDGVLCWIQMKNMVCGGMRCDVVCCGEDGSNTQPGRKRKWFSADPGPV